MDVYRQAAEIVRIVREGRGTAKTLCLRKEMQKKKQTYAVVCETLRHYELLEDVLKQSEFFSFYPHARLETSLVLAYDIVIGRGVNTYNDTTAKAIQNSASFLREAYERVKKHHIIAPRQKQESWEDDVVQLPRYARVNTLKIDTATLVERLRRPKREREEAAATAPRRPPLRLPAFELDQHVPDLLVFPPGTDLHNHPSVRGAQIILQDKSSCLPACVLLDAVPCVPEATALGTEITAAAKKKKASADATAPTGTAARKLEYVLDGCAAPGNKTTQLAALGAPHGIKLLAVERDRRRSELLSQRVQTLGASEHINVMNQDFFDLVSDVREAVEGILLDPSCSASGVVSRVDVSIDQHKKNQKSDGFDEQQESDEEEDSTMAKKATSREDKLAQVQRKLLTHALLSFANCRRVVYSTCSIHEVENEGVVSTVLRDERVKARGWSLTNIMPQTWTSRGRKLSVTDSSGEELPLHYTIRCDPEKDRTNGFYVARFDRYVPEAPAAAKSAKKDEEAAAADATAVATAAKIKEQQEIVVRNRLQNEPPKTLQFASDDDEE